MTKTDDSSCLTTELAHISDELVAQLGDEHSQVADAYQSLYPWMRNLLSTVL